MIWKRGLGLGLVIIGVIIIFTGATITGAVIGNSNLNSISIFGILVFIIGGVLILTENLEEKLKKIKFVKIRRELLSDAHRAKEFAERGFDVNGLWDPKKSYDENKKRFLDTFYDDVDNEISDGYWKAVLSDRGIEYEDFNVNRNKYCSGNEFKLFRKKALKYIHSWNEKVQSGEFVPLFVSSEKDAKDQKNYPNMKSRTVYYGPEDLSDRSRSFYDSKDARKKGKVIVAHEIINREAVDNPDELRKTPHIHWELNYINDEGYQSD